MPKKIKFRVLQASGEDEKYKASELDSHGPSVRGWLSSRNCSYPQEILFSLNNTAVLHQIQVLTHHYIIPERIDVWIGSDDEIDTGKSETGLNNINFEYIGYIILSNNENTKFKCRELKTITIPYSPPTRYVKLTLQENHSNNLNVYNQVGLVAVQLIGEELSADNDDEKIILDTSPNETSQFDDLAFEMYCDKETAELLRRLEEKKKKAVIDERFEYARKLKTAMSKLHTAGEKLGKMEIAKKQAIQQEDYGRAKKKKLQIEEIKTQIRDSLNVDDLLENDGLVVTNDEEPSSEHEEETSSNRSLQKDENEIHSNIEKDTSSEVDSKLQKMSFQPTTNLPPDANTNTNIYSVKQHTGIYESPVSPIHFVDTTTNPVNDLQPSTKPASQSSKNNSLRRQKKNASNNENSYEYGEDHIGCTYRPYYQVEIKEPKAPSVLSQIIHQSKLSEREKKQATLAINIFGRTLVEKIFSKQYSDKEEGLRLLEAALKTYREKEKHNQKSEKPILYNKIGRASVYLCHRCLRDKVFAVYSTAIEIIRYFYTEFINGRVTDAEVRRGIEQILPDLMSKSGDTTPRVHNLAIHTILSLADAPEIRKLNIIPGHLTKILTANIHARLALSRLEMVEQIILNHGISIDKQSGMTCRILAEVGLSGLHHPNEAVRKMAEKILILVYRNNPRLVRRQLPPDDDVTRRNILYRHLMKEFDRIDSERKNQTNQDNCKNEDIVSKYSSCFGKTLKRAKTEQKLKRCIFCHLESDLLIEKELNNHYWKYCPMLMRCTHCNQVIEIAALQEHLTNECEMKSAYRKCQVCSQAVSIEQLNTHHKSVQCTLMAMKKVCPLCFTELEDGENKLRAHLIGTCSKHPRSKYIGNNNLE